MPRVAPALSRVIYSNSAATTASGATPNLNNPTPGTFGAWQSSVEAVSLILHVTTNTGTSGVNAMWVDVETSPDAGTTWVPTLRFTQVTTSTATHRIDFRPNGIGANEVGAQASGIQTQTAALNSNTVMPADVRLRWTLSGGATASVTFAVFAVFQPLGTRGSY